MNQRLVRQAEIAPKPYVTAISVGGIVVFCYAAFGVATAPLNLEWILLAAVTVLVISRMDLGFQRRTGTLNASGTFLFISFFLYGLMPSVLLAGVEAAAATSDPRERRKLMLFNGSIAALSMFGAGIVVDTLLGSSVVSGDDQTRFISAAILLAGIYCVASSALTSVAIAATQARGFFDAWRESLTWTSLAGFGSVVVAALVAKLITVISFYAFIVAVPVLGITYMVYKVYLDKVDTAVKHAEEMAELHLRTIEALAIAIDSKDEVTHDHVERVRIYATGLAQLFGLSEREVEALRAGALLHDIGKVAVPDHILNKPGVLSPAEFEKMKVHAVVGAEILDKVGFPYPVVPVVRHHHERWDGRGYPDGLMGDQIPIAARILSIADTFDAVQEERQYRGAMNREEAINLLREGGGTLFDPEITRTFLDHLPEFDAEIRQRGFDRYSSKLRNGRRQKLQPASTGPRESVSERLRAANRELLALYDLAERIGNRLDIRDVFAIYAGRMREIIPYTTCVLYLFRPDTAGLEVAQVAGDNAEWFRGGRISMGEGITGWVVAHRHPMHNCDPKLDFESLKIELRDQYRTGTVAPLLRDADVLGALALYSADLTSYEPEHLQVVESVAKLLSDTVSQLSNAPKPASALTDPLTGLPNARALRYRFEQQIDHAKRHKDSFSFVIMDLDGFKAFNERLGSQAGDYLLMQVGRLIASQLRPVDFLARYGGDDFVAILQAAPDEIPDLVRKIQRAVCTHDFGVGSPSNFGGVSVGWANFGADGNSLDQLLLVADRAMHTDRLRRQAAASETGSLKTSELGHLNVM